ncbi:MAG TPA: tetratricopeptide repeat protein [Candidatus Sulfotelmatobacter sp.]|nr:tetratricopeptide repeat protein [Candidatus Sulfotelmatobacter sp.]
MTGPNTNVSFGSTRDFAGDITLSGAGKPRPPVDLRRRDFLVRFCQGAGATLIPASLWGLHLPEFNLSAPDKHEPAGAAYQLHPQYRSQRPVDATLLKVQAGLDEFITEKYADEIAAILAEWTASLLRSPRDVQAFAKTLAADFSGGSLTPAESRIVRSGLGLQIWQNKFAHQGGIDRAAFLRELQERLSVFSQIVTAEFQITSLEAASQSELPAKTPSGVSTRILYEIVGSGNGFHREQQVGNWALAWEPASTGNFLLRSWVPVDETRARSSSPVYADVTAAALGENSSYAAQMLHGTDYWRTVVDGASGIDIYGHNGVSVADIDNDGFDDLYVCQPAGLPNRLYRNRGDGTFEDITEISGLGILENTACALFADFSNVGRQDVIVVRANGPLFFQNEGRGKFRQKPDAFQFANPPQGTFTGAAVADYDRDGWLDIYFCLYAYYQGTGQYKYPSPYHAAENGPPNFLMRNHRDGMFRDVTAECGLNQNNTRYSFCCGWSDYNGDGWPDLYVVNDFGRKNLYRNNGDGKFTDVAPQAGVEDVGAGMSVSWLDYDNDGAEDLYVANMWTAAGERVSAQEVFKKESSAEVRALYQKHAMGNSLFHNRGAVLEEATKSSGVGMGRWAWSSDAFDFDHDGFLDLYIANGMVSGPLRQDLNSFFWRQAVARSPDEARGSGEYEQGWNAINELIRSDGTWSGYERNVFYANNRDGTFSHVSAVVGLDFVEDGRAFAVADFDRDGRLEVLLKNRNAPQLRLLKNVMEELPPSIAFRLQSTKSNRDAIGATVTIKTSSGQQTRLLRAGSGFLSQNSKDIFFGLGETKGRVRASIRWPSGVVQELHDLPLNHRIWVVEGFELLRMEAFKAVAAKGNPAAEVAREVESLPAKAETWLLAPVSAPEFSLPDLKGQAQSLSVLRGHPALLNFFTMQSPDCKPDLKTLQELHLRYATQGLRVIAVNADGEKAETEIRGSVPLLHISFPILRGSDDVLAVYNILYRQLFDRHRDLSLPTSFLIDGKGNVVKVYQGVIDAEHAGHDFQTIPQTDAERLARGLPFPSSTYTLEFGRNYLSLGSLFFQRGYLDQAESWFQQAFHDDPSSAEALYGIGSVYLNQNKNGEAREVFERAVKLTANYPDTLPDAWTNLGVIATRENRVDDSVSCFQEALRLNPHHLVSLDNLGNAYRVQKRWDDARKVLERALNVAPEDPEANYSLGMVFAQTDDTAKAYEYLQRALKVRPVYPEALNNLGVLYLVAQRRDQAVASFEECIRVAPAFDQAYLNLARVYALEGARDRARGVLLDLLKQHPDHPQGKQMLEQLR